MLATWILYHIFCLLSIRNFIFLKFFLIVCFSKTIICDSSVIIPLGVMLVNHKIQIFLIILFVSLNIIISIDFRWHEEPYWLRTSHFQCGQCEGRRSQSSEARTQCHLDRTFCRWFSMLHSVMFWYLECFEMKKYANFPFGVEIVLLSFK